MKTKDNSMAGGVLMLCGLVILLTVPMVIGHFALSPAAPAPIQVSSANMQ